MGLWLGSFDVDGLPYLPSRCVCVLHQSPQTKQTITDGLRSMAEEKQHDGGDGGDGGGGYYGPAGAGAGMMNGNRHAGGARDEEERRRRREEVLRSVARVLLGIGRYVVQVRTCIVCLAQRQQCSRSKACMS